MPEYQPEDIDFIEINFKLHASPAEVDVLYSVHLKDGSEPATIDGSFGVADNPQLAVNIAMLALEVRQQLGDSDVEAAV